jgi:T5orf172 domain
MVAITAEESRSVLQLAIGLIKRRSFTLEKLAEIAERSCCARHHRNKIWGSKLADSLAFRWQHEVLNYMPSASSKSAQIVKVEDLSLRSSDTGGYPRQSVYTDQAQNHGQLHNPSKLVAFSKHVVFEGDTMDAVLLSVIEPSASKIGSVYIFTHTHDAFRGMIKIGYTSRSIDQRLNEWVECGHGVPRLLDSRNNVRHPERVELLTHFQLAKHWYTMRWCNYHRQAHIEWFKTDASTASQVIQSWSSWIQRSNPYDRRGVLKVFWQGIVEFLAAYEICITAELMLQIQEVEEGSIDVSDFFDDDMLRKEHAKQGHVDSLYGAEAIIARNCGHLTLAPKIKSENTCANLE